MRGNKEHQPRPGFTLERAILVALVLHLLLGGVVTWWPGLLVPAQLAAELDSQPLDFTFVDTPDPEPPPETPDTDTLSDIDRRAADASPREDQADPFSEGNTTQTVVRPAQLPQEERLADPSPDQPEADPAEATEEPVEAPAETEATDSEQPAATAAENPPEDNVAEPQPTAPPVPPRRRTLRDSLVRLESVVEPQVYDNPGGGVDAPQSLAQFDTRGYDLGAYLRAVLSEIERNWRANIPPLIRTGVGGATFVGLSIRRHRIDDGTEVAILVAERTWSSGQPAYDSAALFSLELSTPLPAIPSLYPYETIQGRLGYIYNLDHEQIDFPDQ